MANALTRLSNTIDTQKTKFINYASDNKGRLIKSISSGLLLLVIFAIYGCFDFITLKFDFSQLYSVAYWSKVIAKAVAGGICAYNIGINLLWDKTIEKDEVLQEAVNEYDTKSKLKDQKSFNYFVINEFNPRQKKIAWVDSINSKLFLLNKFARNKDKLLWDNGNEAEKGKNRYCRKRKELEYLRSDEYIDKNLNSINIRYSMVDPLVFELTLDGKRKYKGVKVSGSVGGEKAKSTATTFLTMIGVSMVITSIALDTNRQQFETQMQAFVYYLLTCAVDTGTIVWRVLTGMFACPKLIRASITEPLIGRNQVLGEYIDWCSDNKVEKSKSFILLEKIKEEKMKESEVNA